MTESLNPRRYDTLNERNRHSWYMTEARRPFDVVQSVHSAGKFRLSTKAPDSEAPYSPHETNFIRSLNRAARTIMEWERRGSNRLELAGNMSPVRRPDGQVPYGPSTLTDDERYKDALTNMMTHFQGIGVDPAMVRVLKPERDYDTPLTVVNVDKDEGIYQGSEPVQLAKAGDFIYTRNPDIVLAVRPADCPVVIMEAETPEGPIGIMIHYAWRGPANGQLEDTKRELDALGINYASIRAYITAGGHTETFRFTDYVPNEKDYPEPIQGYLFDDIKSNIDDHDRKRYSFGVDTPYAVYQGFKKFGLADNQIFIDTSDTTSRETGYASHSRAINLKDDNVRDIVTAQFHW